jgi:hypothetical protein
MVSVEGSEISGPHHMNSLFTRFTTGAETEREAIEQIRDLGGSPCSTIPAGRVGARCEAGLGRG